MLFLFTACQKIELDNRKSGSSSSQNNSSSTIGSSPSDDNQMSGTLSDNSTVPSEVGGHVAVLMKEQNENYTKWLLISLKEWNGVCSAYSEENPTEARVIATGYNENGLAGWRLPTRDEAKAIYDKYYCSPYDDENEENIIRLNRKLESLNAELVTVWVPSNELPSYRYLCDEAYRSFSLKIGSQISTAGTKTKYNLRLVKDTIITNTDNGTPEDISFSF